MARALNVHAGKPLEDVPAYRVRDAARIARLSPSTLRLWASGDGHPALFVPASTAPLLLSF